MKIHTRFVGLITVLALLVSCQKTRIERQSGFPDEIGEILVSECATSGCHNSTSAAGAGGLNLESWDDLFNGSFGGSAVVPYRPDQSFLMFFMNTFDDLGTVLEPSMPYNQAPLSREKIELVQNWIEVGAPDCDGVVKWSDRLNRKKYYVLNQGCDLVSVFDSETDLIMRYVDVGILDGFVESPHLLKISPNGKYWGVVFLSGNPYFELYSTTTDELVSRIEIGNGSWNTFFFTHDSKYAYAVDLSSAPNGKVAIVDIENLDGQFSPISGLQWPHGSYVSPDDQILYVTQQYGDGIYKFDISNPTSPEFMDIIDMEQGTPPLTGNRFDIHEIIYSPKGDVYFTTCEGTNEVRAFNITTDELVKVFQVGDEPVEFAFSESNTLMFVTCVSDSTMNQPGEMGSVAIFNYETLTLLKHLYTGHQPHGMAEQPDENVLIVANRNINPGGPAPHHTTECGGTNGYIVKIDLSTLELVPGFKEEVSVDPYSVAVKL